MKDSEDIQGARYHLNLVNMLNGDTAHHIDEGFFMLEEIEANASSESVTAKNLGQTYMNRFCESVREELSKKSIPEPQLESLLETVSALEATTFAEGMEIGELKKAVASRLIDSYFQGYTKVERNNAINELLERIGKEKAKGT